MKQIPQNPLSRQAMAQTTNANGRTKFKVLYDKGAVSVYPQLPYLPKRPQQHSFAVSTWTKS